MKMLDMSASKSNSPDDIQTSSVELILEEHVAHCEQSCSHHMLDEQEPPRNSTRGGYTANGLAASWTVASRALSSLRLLPTYRLGSHLVPPCRTDCFDRKLGDSL